MTIVITSLLFRVELFCWSLFCDILFFSVLSSFVIILLRERERERERESWLLYFNLVFQLCCCSVPISCGPMSWLVVCDCAISFLHFVFFLRIT